MKRKSESNHFFFSSPKRTNKNENFLKHNFNPILELELIAYISICLKLTFMSETKR